MLQKKDVVIPDDNIINDTVTPGGQLLPAGGNDNVPPVVGKNREDISQQERDELDVTKLASFFVSMLGSYSSDSNFENIIDLKPMMTVKMQLWADDFIKRNLDNNINKDEFITTKVFSSEILSSSTNEIVVLVETRREAVLNGEQKLYNQDATVVVNKVGVNWLVDTVEWK